MKNISLILAGVLVCTLAAAKGIEKPVASSSYVVVTNPTGSSLFKLHYQSGKTQNVRVTLVDNRGNEIFQETIKKTDRFVRPYNFKDLEQGEYAIHVEDENGKMVEKVSFNNSVKIEKWVKITKMTDAENKFSLIVSSAKKDMVTISVFDNDSNLVHSETQMVSNGFAKVYNIKGLDAFTIEVADSNGVVKSMKYSD
jgi:hypothetical protein